VSWADTARQNRVAWEQGIIGKGEAILLDRYPIPRLCAKGLMTTVNSLGISNLSLLDIMEPVRPNVWIGYIAPSGTGVKTPPLVRIRSLVRNYCRGLLAPPKFTPEGFTEWVIGAEGKLASDSKTVVRKPVPPHPHCIIIRDEGSRLLGESKWSPHLATMKEYLSELWDGYIEGYYTRKCQYEGEVEDFVSLALFSSPYFYELLDENFFAQGTGNRILWNVENKRKPERLNKDEFFFSLGSKDTDWNDFEQEILSSLKNLEKIGDVGGLDDPAKTLWVDFQKDCMDKSYAEPSRSAFASYIVKQPLNALKLAMNYAASVNSVDVNNILWILEEDMQRAIEDTRVYIENWKQVLKEWNDWSYKIEGKKQQKHLSEKKYELTKFLRFAIAQPEKLVCSEEISAELDCPDKTTINDILHLGVSKDWLEIYSKYPDSSKLTAEQIKRFERGNIVPTIYKVTEQGEKECQ